MEQSPSDHMCKLFIVASIFQVKSVFSDLKEVTIGGQSELVLVSVHTYMISVKSCMPFDLSGKRVSSYLTVLAHIWSLVCLAPSTV